MEKVRSLCVVFELILPVSTVQVFVLLGGNYEKYFCLGMSLDVTTVNASFLNLCILVGNIQVNLQLLEFLGKLPKESRLNVKSAKPVNSSWFLTIY